MAAAVTATAVKSIRLAAGMVKMMLADTAFVAVALVSIAVATIAVIVFEATVFEVVFIETQAQSRAAVWPEVAGAKLQASTAIHPGIGP